MSEPCLVIEGVGLHPHPEVVGLEDGLMEDGVVLLLVLLQVAAKISRLNIQNFLNSFLTRFKVKHLHVAML